MRPSPLPNRVDPFGEIHAVPSRGGCTGNRGVIHQGYEIIRRSGTDGWVTCVLDFKGRRRELMLPNRWTELFFLDEATAFAAGHRPCFFCRRDAALRFAEAFGEAMGEDRRATAPEMDAALKRERRHVGRRRRAEREALLAALPKVVRADLAPGAVVSASGEAYLYMADGFRRWSFTGYSPGEPSGEIRLLTPASALRAFHAGYAPELHPSAHDAATG